MGHARDTGALLALLSVAVFSLAGCGSSADQNAEDTDGPRES
jgi:hypothetical protein